MKIPIKRIVNLILEILSIELGFLVAELCFIFTIHILYKINIKFIN